MVVYREPKVVRPGDGIPRFAKSDSDYYCAELQGKEFDICKERDLQIQGAVIFLLIMVLVFAFIHCHSDNKL